jgi:hypothetical protein
MTTYSLRDELLAVTAPLAPRDAGPFAAARRETAELYAAVGERSGEEVFRALSDGIARALAVAETDYGRIPALFLAVFVEYFDRNRLASGAEDDLDWQATSRDYAERVLASLSEVGQRRIEACWAELDRRFPTVAGSPLPFGEDYFCSCAIAFTGNCRACRADQLV